MTNIDYSGTSRHNTTTSAWIILPYTCIQHDSTKFSINNFVNILYFNILTNDGRCTSEIKSRIAIAKAAFSKKKTLFTNKLDLNLRKKLIKCYIWNMAFYGAETWTLRAADQKYLESFEKWCWRRVEKISLTDHVRNEEVLLESMSRGISYRK